MKKGFTLVELLAVIVILAVISIITIPLIGNVIEDSKKKALEQSVRGLVETARYFALSNSNVQNFVFDDEKKGKTEDGNTLNYKGEIDAEGSLYIDKDGNISLCLMNEKYYVYKNYNSEIYIGNVSEDTCIIGYDALTDKYVAMLDDGSGSVTNVYSKEQIDNIVIDLNNKININTNNITELEDKVNENKQKISELNNNYSTLENNNLNNTSTISTIQQELSDFALTTDLDTSESNIEILSTLATTNTDNITALKNDLAIKDSAVYNYIKSDGTYQNIDTELNNILGSMPNTKTGYITDVECYVHDFNQCILLVHNQLKDKQSISTHFRYANSETGAVNSFIIVGGRFAYNRGRYLATARTNDKVYLFEVTDNDVINGLQLVFQ